MKKVIAPTIIDQTMQVHLALDPHGLTLCGLPVNRPAYSSDPGEPCPRCSEHARSRLASGLDQILSKKEAAS